MSTASVHRFHDCIAASLGDGSTTYLTPAQARKFATALNLVARSVEKETFLQSHCGSFNLELVKTGPNGTNYTHARTPK